MAGPDASLLTICGAMSCRVTSGTEIVNPGVERAIYVLVPVLAPPLMGSEGLWCAQIPIYRDGNLERWAFCHQLRIAPISGYRKANDHASINS